MEILTGDSRLDNTENTGVMSCSVFSCCTVSTEVNTHTAEDQIKF